MFALVMLYTLYTPIYPVYPCLPEEYCIPCIPLYILCTLCTHVYPSNTVYPVYPVYPFLFCLPMFTKVILYISREFFPQTTTFHILIDELHFLVWNLCYLIGLSQSFLTNRTQALCIGNILPQGIKMGVPLFSI